MTVFLASLIDGSSTGVSDGEVLDGLVFIERISVIVFFFYISVMLNFSSRKFPDLTGCFPDTPKRAGSIPHLLVDCVPFFGDNLSVGFFGVKSDHRNPGDVNKVNVYLLFFHQIYLIQMKREWFLKKKIFFCTLFCQPNNSSGEDRD